MCASMRHKASATASQVGVVVLSNQQISTSVLQRSSSPRWFFSMVPSWWLFKSRFTPSECQSKTDFKAFLSAFKVGVSGAVGQQNTRKNSINDALVCTNAVGMLPNSPCTRACPGTSAITIGKFTMMYAFEARGSDRFRYEVRQHHVIFLD